MRDEQSTKPTYNVNGPGVVRASISFPKSVFKAAKKRAVDEELGWNEFVSHAVSEYIKYAERLTLAQTENAA